MKHILSISYTQDSKSFDEVVEILGEEYRITQYATNFNFELSKNLIYKYDGLCDVIALSGLPPNIRYHGGFFAHPQVEKLKAIPRESVIVDGSVVKNIYLPYALRQLHRKMPKLFPKKNVSFYAGALQYPIIELFEEWENNVLMADPYFLTKLPFIIKGRSKLDKFIKFTTPVFRRMKIKRGLLSEFKDGELSAEFLKEFYDSSTFVGNQATVRLINHDHLKGKTLVLDHVNDDLKQHLLDLGVSKIVAGLPKLVNIPNFNFPILEALIQCRNGDNSIVSENDVMRVIEEFNLECAVYEGQKSKDEIDKFAFIIHPLSSKMLFKHPALKFLKPISNTVEPILEEVMAGVPGFLYGKINNVQSDSTGKTVEGLIYSVAATPKKLVEGDVDKIYRQLIKVCDDASRAGAKIIGLGAYTKIVGDAGITVENMSPIPLTTGNSLSACATLWAAKYALEKMGFVERKDKIYQGKVCIIGATGSIGAVSAKVLAAKWKDLVLVAPRGYKLLELKQEILEIFPEANIEVSTNADAVCEDIDLFITTTSSRGKKILDIEKVKPGAVICDVSRPFDIKVEDALKRPDVMVIASGEVQLPGNVDMKVDLGLEGNIVYACLAETALLALNETFESFTLGRNINYQNVVEIDRMAKEHGVKLSSIMGHSGFITDEEFKLCREHALTELKKLDEK